MCYTYSFAERNNHKMPNFWQRGQRCLCFVLGTTKKTEIHIRSTRSREHQRQIKSSKRKKKGSIKGGMIYLKRDLTLEKPVEKEDLAACCWAIRLA